MAKSHPWFTLIGGALCIWLIYLCAKIFVEMQQRLDKLRFVLGTLLNISACQCNNAGTCAYCNASRVLPPRCVNISRITMLGRTSEARLFPSSPLALFPHYACMNMS
jgi:hypothetical protein